MNAIKDVDHVKLLLKKIIAEDLDSNIEIGSIKDDVSLFDDGIGLDSISMVNLMVHVEKKFNISFDDEEVNLATFKNVNSLAQYIQSKGAAKVPQD
jgi:acyl carrier protein